jgi:Spy/CpxP family protein refolding chaperone
MKSKLSVVLLWILVFFLGCVSGAVGHYLYQAHLKSITQTNSPKSKDIVNGMAQELDLDAKQKEALKEIFGQIRQQVHELNQQYKPMYEALNQQYKPRFEAIRDESDSRIRRILRAEQMPRFEAFLKKVHAAPPLQPKQPALK